MKEVNSGLRDFLRGLDYSNRARIKATIFLQCEITDNSFNQKLTGRTPFTKLEKEKISEVTGQPIDQLFDL